MLSLRQGSAHAALGADDDVAYLVTRLRQVWPDVVLHFRGDCGFCLPGTYEVCEGLRVSYAFGLGINALLQRETEGLLAEAVAAYERERQAARQQDPPRPPAPSRLFAGFWYQAGSWPQPRWVVAKAEANDRGTNRRFVVSNRPGAMLLPGPTYDEYAGRGESENRNKEFKCDLAMYRLSDRRFVANDFRLYLHAAAMNLLVRLRRSIAEPLPARSSPFAAACRSVATSSGQTRRVTFAVKLPSPSGGSGESTVITCRSWRMIEDVLRPFSSRVKMTSTVVPGDKNPAGGADARIGRATSRNGRTRSAGRSLTGVSRSSAVSTPPAATARHSHLLRRSS
jgi:Transposase DDE domain group 1